MSTLEIKAVALDIYGAVLATSDFDNELPPRIGINGFLERCCKNQIRLCTCSDNNTPNVQIDLKESGVNLDYFECYFEMEFGLPKDFSKITQYYYKKWKLLPSQILVIGDSLERDIRPALEIGCSVLHVPEYSNQRDNFDFMKIKF